MINPATGRFLTRDPAPPNLADPQSLHPYVFANSSPLVFTDPTGFFSMSIGEVNVVVNTQTVMASIRSGVQIALRERLKEKVGQALTNVFATFLDQTVGMGLQEFIFAKVGFENLKPWQLGNYFEDSVRETVCEWFPINSSWIWFEPGIDQINGEPTSNGLSCEERERRVGRRKGQRYPDLLIKRIFPTLDHEKTILTGEVKLGIGTFYRAWIRPGGRKEQFQAIVLHAKRFSYTPHLVFLLSLKQGKGYQRKVLQRRLREQRVQSWIRALF